MQELKTALYKNLHYGELPSHLVENLMEVAAVLTKVRSDARNFTERARAKEIQFYDFFPYLKYYKAVSSFILEHLTG